MNTDLVRELDHGLRQLVQFRGLIESAGLSEGLNVSVSEAIALGRVQEEPLSQQQLGEYLGLEKSTVSRLVDGLAAKGWVTREPSPDNRRVRIVALSAEGRAVAANVEQAMRNRHTVMLERLTPGEREALAIALPALVRALAESAG
jgi:DNA-binding MarR family transcriptional regulator